MQAVVELALKTPFELRVIEIARVQIEIIGVDRDRRILEVNDYFDAFALGARVERHQGMFIQKQLRADAL